MKKRLLSLLCAVSLLYLPCTPSVLAADREGQKAADMLLSMDLLSIETAGILDTRLIGENLNNPANQLTAVALLIRLSGADTASAQAVKMPGVPADMEKDLGYAISRGWVNQWEFGAETPLEAGDWFAMLLRFLGYGRDFPVEEATIFAWRIGLVPREYKGILKGADLAETAMCALRFPYKDGTGTVAGKLILQGKCTSAAFSLLGISGRDLSVREVADRYASAVIGLDLYESGGDEPDGYASGFFLTPDGIAVTCFHSLKGVSRAVANLVTKERYNVTSILWADEQADLALVRVSRTSTEGKTTSRFAYLETDKAETVRPGDMSYSLGSPLGKGQAVNQGTVSTVGVEMSRYSQPCIISAATISIGSGGGALLSTSGKAIGVTCGAFQYGNAMYLSVPTDALENALKNAGGGGQSLSSFGSAHPKPKKETKSEGDGEGDGEKEEKPDYSAIVEY